ncbi:Rhamnogalacturonan endolyase [Psidium guajava]|nr:Rhamnogalacturonan endolyase [Psidium guajava]
MEKDESPKSTATVAVNFGASIIVPSVQELAREPIVNLPPRYARCSDQDLPLVSRDASESVPVVDVELLARGDPLELEKLHFACRDWGFFQVVNHGVSMLLLEEFKREIESFFDLPYEEKQKLWQQPENHEGFGQLFVVSEEQKLDWSDMFYITTLPLGLRKADLFEKLPNNLRDKLEVYSFELKKLARSILSHMARALKMNAEEIRELFGDGVQAMRMNYYPPCPEPDMAIGFTPHSDADALTILLQLNETEGLQIRKEGKWVPVKPLHNAFVVNIGDIMEIVSNGIYRSIEHRATVNSTKKRLSVATFYSCRLDTVLGPAPSLISSDNPAIFRRVPVEAYFKEFFNRKLNGKSYLDFMRTARAL